MRGFLLSIFFVGCAPASSAPGDAAAEAPSTAVDRGSVAIVRRACPDCHMAPDGTLSGVTTPRPSTQSYPANLTPDTTTGLGAWAISDIARAIRFGIDDVSAAPSWVALCPTMPRFDTMTEEEARDIAAFLKTLPPVQHAIPRSVCPPFKLADAGASD